MLLCPILQECPPSDDFRTQQCASFNSRPFRGWYYKWTPYTELTDSKTHSAF